MVNIESTSNAIWWIKKPNKAAKKGKGKGGMMAGWRKKSLGSSFCLDMTDLLRNISLQGYNKLLAADLTWGERLIWLLLHTTTFITLLVVLSLTWEQFVAQYFVTNLKDPLYPVENVPFPAVSICSNNRISMQAATKYARELELNDPSPRTLSYYLEHLRYLRDFYSSVDRSVDSESFVSFQSFLDLFGTWNNETFFDTRRIMKLLSPKCQDFILKCSLSNVDIPCFSQDAFENSLTMYGPCCTFNVGNKLKKRSFKNRMASSAMGLTVVLNASKADYFAPILNTNGYIVIVHNADNYASVSSSNALEMFPGQYEESFLQIYARVVDTDSSLNSFSPFNRRCYFDHEATVPSNEQLMKSIYTFPNCITRCRIRSIIALCRCLPFQMPLELVETLDGVVYCTLSHIPCINQYLFKWRNVLTERHIIPGLEREIEEALYCPQCLPSCNDVQYSVSLSALPIDNYLATLKSESTNETGIETETDINKDISVLRVFFGEPHAQYYIRLLNNAWFEVFSTIGNIMSIFVGFSMVAIFEIVFFLSKYIYMGCNRMVEQNLIDRRVKQLEDQKLYICP